MSFVKTLALVGLVASPATAFWRLPCAAPVVVERLDPIVNPGALSGHLHTVMGGNAFDRVMDYNTTQSSSCTSCRVQGDLSNYWIPVLYFKHPNGTYQKVKQTGGALVYYLQRRGNDKNEKLEAFPEGFRMVAGDPKKRTGGDDFATQAISYNCLNYKGPAKPETNSFPNYNCPDGLRSQVFFPACWDGKNLDSPDHKSHVAYPVSAYNSGSCPDSHPRHMISIFYEVIWNTGEFADMWTGGQQPFVWSMDDTTGYGLHGDFLNGWDVDLLQRAVDQCTNDSGRVEDCNQFKLYDNDVANKCKKTSTVNEAIDFVQALPGLNGAAPVVGAVDSPSASPDAGAGYGDTADGGSTPSTTTAAAATTTSKTMKAQATSTGSPGGFYEGSTTAASGAQPTSCNGAGGVTITETVISTVYGDGLRTTSIPLNGHKPRMHKRHGLKHGKGLDYVH